VRHDADITNPLERNLPSHNGENANCSPELPAFCLPPRFDLPAIMREGLVRLRHAVGIVLLLHC
jgi:hypothetical protein